MAYNEKRLSFARSKRGDNDDMNFSRRVTRCALVGWALYLIIALSAFALHTHSSHEGGAAPCAICLAQSVTGAAAVVAVFALIAPAFIWRMQLWRGVFSRPIIAVCARPYFSRGPPASAFSLAAN